MALSKQSVGKLPASLDDLRSLLRSLDYQKLKNEVERDLDCRVCIVGPVNSGKSTLFNLLHGRTISPVAAVPGTTRHLVREDLGPFTLLDTPGFGEVEGVDRASVALEGLHQSTLAILLLDAGAGVRQEDYELLRRLLLTGKPVIVALNKTDLIKKELDSVLADAEVKLGSTVVPISSKEGTNVSDGLIPRIINAHPGLAVAIGRELPAYRRRAVDKVVATAAALSAVAGAEPIPGASVPVLLAAQVKLVLRIAAIYGEPMTAHHARELVATVFSGMALRYAARELAKFVPVVGWAVAGAMAGASTFAIGRVAAEYFESGKTLRPREMQALYRLFSRQARAAGETGH